MKKLLTIGFILLLSKWIYADNILTKDEKVRISKAFVELKSYQNVPNFIHCNSCSNNLEKFVCGNQDLIKMFHLLSMANVYAWENATKRGVDHAKHNEKHMKYWIDKYDTTDIDLPSLCYDLKVETTNLLGGMSPYNVVTIDGDLKGDYIVQENIHGMILSGIKGYRIYIGVSNDVMDSNKNKGSWYKKNNKYFMLVNGSESSFSYDMLHF